MRGFWVDYGSHFQRRSNPPLTPPSQRSSGFLVVVEMGVKKIGLLGFWIFAQNVRCLKVRHQRGRVMTVATDTVDKKVVSPSRL